MINAYVGSSVNLGNRLRNYFHYSYLSNSRGISLIKQALLKYGYSSFKVEILEYCDPTVVREQHLMDLLKPEYNRG